MTLSNIAGLFGAMAVLALIPSPSVFAVVARAIASGFMSSVVTTIGIVVGDFVFILLALYGLNAIADTLDSLFIIVKYIGSVYLIWLGIKLWRAKPQKIEMESMTESSWINNFLSGLLITLSDPKAIVFYMSFLPGFIDLSNLSIADTFTILLIATLSVGGAKLGYAYMGDRARFFFKNNQARKNLNVLAGTIMMITGVLLLKNS